MHHDNRELWFALLAIFLITAIYLAFVVRLGSIPAAGEFFGHSLGVLGFVLMLMTETLYSVRKRSARARWGRAASWLKFHIFTGIVGPFLVLLHSSWKFNGLAGVVLLLTVLIVISGFVGRYIYTSIPRTASGTILEVNEIETEIAHTVSLLNELLASQPELPQQVFRNPAAVSEMGISGPFTVLGRLFLQWDDRIRWWQAMRQLSPELRAHARRYGQLIQRQRTLHRQMFSLGIARRLLGIWHTVHIPLGAALFTAAFIHILAALYYATLLR